MKDSIIRWVAAFALLAVIAVAAIFVVDDDEVSSEAIEEKFQALENETSSVDENHTLLDQDGNSNPKRDFKKEKFDRRDGLKKKKSKGKFDRAGRGGKSKKGKPGMSKPLPPMMGEGFMPPMMGEMDGGHWGSHDRHMPPMMGEGFMPPMMGMMGEGFMPPMMGEFGPTGLGEGFMPPMMGEMDGGHWGSHDRHMPPMMGEGFMPPMMGMMGEGFMPPMMGEFGPTGLGEGFMPPMMGMMGEGFERRESEIFKEIQQIFDSILDSLESIEKSDSVGSKATDEEISQSGELTLSLIEELIKETFDQRFEDEISELVDRVAKDAVTQIIEGLNQESYEQSLEGTTESN